VNFQGIQAKGNEAPRRLAENEIITCDLENPSNDAKGKDE
jgi:hypothetical protein